MGAKPVDQSGDNMCDAFGLTGWPGKLRPPRVVVGLELLVAQPKPAQTMQRTPLALVD